MRSAPHHRSSRSCVRSIICGFTWGVLGLQYVKWMARSGKGKSARTISFAVSSIILIDSSIADH